MASAGTEDLRFLRACRGEQVDCTPVWLMRQAGRYLKEYQEIRQKASFMELCKSPELACEISLLPTRRFDLDAAIIFSDILVPLEAMGVDLDIVEQQGPIIQSPVRDRAAAEKLPLIDPREATPFLLDATRLLKQALGDSVPVIGFAGAPFTLASYAVEGSHSRDYAYIKSLIFNEPDVYGALMQKLSEVIGRYLNAQIDVGADAVQIFDTWAGCLSAQDYKRLALPYTRAAIESIKDKSVPVIHFTYGNAALLDFAQELGASVISIDWRIDIDIAWERIGSNLAIQGNLDPVVLFAKPSVIEERVRDILKQAGNRVGHIFNLGHGVLPQTPAENVRLLVDAVHKYSRR